MLSVSFIFTSGDLTDEFFALDAEIEQAATETPGFIGKESWVAVDGDKRNSVYFWRDDEALAAFARNPRHIEAKRRYREWYTGFNVVIARIEKSYGDGQLQSPLPNDRRSAR